MVKVKVTTVLELDLKETFEQTEIVHRKKFADALEVGIRTILTDMNHTTFIDQEIVRKEQESLRLNTETQNLKTIRDRIKEIKIQGSNGNGEDIHEELRNELFEKNKDSIIKLWMKGDINWDSVMPKYHFTDKKQATEWFRNKIEEAKP